MSTEPCFAELALPPSIAPDEGWRIRFWGPETLELLSEGGLRFRRSASGEWWELTENLGEHAAEIQRSSLFFAGQREPCSRDGSLVPRMGADATKTKWIEASCERRCPVARRVSPLPRSPSRLKLSLFLAATRAHRFALARSLTPGWDPDILAPAKLRKSVDQGAWVGLKLGFGPAAIIQSAGPRWRKPPSASKNQSLEEREALARIRCGVAS